MTLSTGQPVETREGGRGGIPQDTFAVRLAAVRIFAGNLTIQQAAERCGLVDQSWSNWERGVNPRDKSDVVAAISAALEIDRDWLMWGGPLATPEVRVGEARRRFEMGRRLRRPTAGYGDRVIRARAHSSHRPAEVSQPDIPDRPTPSHHRPPGRNEGASTSPGLARPAILHRRTSV